MDTDVLIVDVRPTFHAWIRLGFDFSLPSSLSVYVGVPKLVSERPYIVELDEKACVGEIFPLSESDCNMLTKLCERVLSEKIQGQVDHSNMAFRDGIGYEVHLRRGTKNITQFWTSNIGLAELGKCAAIDLGRNAVDVALRIAAENKLGKYLHETIQSYEHED